MSYSKFSFLCLVFELLTCTGFSVFRLFRYSAQWWIVWYIVADVVCLLCNLTGFIYYMFHRDYMNAGFNVAGVLFAVFCTWFLWRIWRDRKRKLRRHWVLSQGCCVIYWSGSSAKNPSGG